MKKNLLLTLIALLTIINVSLSQEIQTLFRGGRTTGYGAISNKSTTINGEYANLVELYGGVYLNKHVLLGLGGAALTNNISVPPQYSVDPYRDLSYQYVQFGLASEYVFGSDKAVHVVLQLFSGAGLTVQYDRYQSDDDGYDNLDDDMSQDNNWFYVVEPGVQVEVNLFKWMRLSPGVSYRATHGSEAEGLTDSKLSDWSYNITLKFGKF